MDEKVETPKSIKSAQKRKEEENKNTPERANKKYNKTPLQSTPVGNKSVSPQSVTVSVFSNLLHSFSCREVELYFTEF